MVLATEKLATPAPELVIEREFSAPRDLVFKLWSEAEHRARWWGPKGHGLGEFSFDFRPGGAWAVSIENPDGTTARMHGAFIEIVAPSRLSFTYLFEAAGIDSVVEINFLESAKGTLMQFRQSPFPNTSERDSHEWGWSSSFLKFTERLQHLLLNNSPYEPVATSVAIEIEMARERAAEEKAKAAALAAKQSAAHDLTIVRLFDAPRELVFEMWTNPAYALRWMGPRDYPAVVFEQDVRVGGTWRGCLKGGPESHEPGAELWQGGTLLEIEPPEKLVFTFAWEGGPETVVTVVLTEDGGRTRMVFHQTPFETVGNRDGHQGGWNSAFDRLVELFSHPMIAGQLGKGAVGGVSGAEADIRAAKHRHEGDKA